MTNKNMFKLTKKQKKRLNSPKGWNWILGAMLICMLGFTILLSIENNDLKQDLKQNDIQFWHSMTLEEAKHYKEMEGLRKGHLNLSNTRLAIILFGLGFIFHGFTFVSVRSEQNVK